MGDVVSLATSSWIGSSSGGVRVEYVSLALVMLLTWGAQGQFLLKDNRMSLGNVLEKHATKIQSTTQCYAYAPEGGKDNEDFLPPGKSSTKLRCHPELEMAWICRRISSKVKEMFPELLGIYTQHSVLMRAQVPPSAAVKISRAIRFYKMALCI